MNTMRKIDLIQDIKIYLLAVTTETILPLTHISSTFIKQKK
jgi:hypothetical protein